jgi:hypothetical protein
MKKALKCLNWFLFLIVPFISLSFSFAVGSINRFEYNRTLVSDFGSSLANNNERFLLRIDNTNEYSIEWSRFFSIYNHDFYNERFSAGFRISDEKYTISLNEKEVGVCLSDIWQTDIANNEDNNAIGLTVSESFKGFDDTSIILPFDIANYLGASIGDKITISFDNEDFELAVFSIYTNTNGFNDETYLNNTLLHDFPTTSFISTDVFNKNLTSYSSNVFFGKDAKKLNACLTELSPIIGVDKNKFIVDDTILNHKLINGQTFIDYSLELLEKVNSLNHYNFTLVFFGFFAIEFLLIVVELIALSRIIKTSDSLVRHPIISCSGFLLFDVLYGVIVTLIGKRILENISTNFGVFILPTFSLRCLSAVTIVIGFLTLLVWMIESYFKTSVTKIKNLLDNNSRKCSAIEKINNISSNNANGGNIGCEVTFSDVSKKTIIAFGSFYHAYSAGSLRIKNFGKMSEQLGFNFCLSCWSDSFEKIQISENSIIHPFAIKPHNVLQKFITLFNPTKNIKKVLKTYCGHIDSIIVYSAFPLVSAIYIKRFCIKNKIKLIFDVVEKFDIKHCTFSGFFSSFIQNRLINNHLISNKVKVISISKYFETFYTKKGIETVRIPFINYPIESTSAFGEKTKKDKTVIAYIGNPAKKKDLLKPIFEAIAKLSIDQRNSLQFIIAGVTVEQLCLTEGINKNDFELAGESIVVAGKLNQDQIKMLYSCIDYTILIRDERSISSKAGFPTKISESLRFGIPPICNITSDLGDFLNETNSIIVGNHSSDSIVVSLKQIMDLRKDDYDCLSANALDTSKHKLSCDAYLNDFKKILM